ncbi:deoxyribodipyrimidine photo-lyase-related protein [Halolamina pelagica]|uniref:Deoxyribodipyrimidine photo-lyase-related protein n=1 Tax=Halolamina pelagica TaxID=699431 RepID=A0A0P7GPY4_9EURY|nr:cryptochrome/photolyase family protein [Halolamina pelagica]KPN30658.1 deoxyribodipyrimidine photo-lyase-related protein [Halolamina pelagica]
MTLWLLGTQLDRTAASLDEHDRVLLIEASGFADRRPYHPHKLTLVFAAMRQFRDDVRARGLTVDYRQADTFAAALDAHFDAHPGDHLTMPRPAAHGAESRLRALVDARGGTLSFVRNPTFLLTPAEFDEWAESRNTNDPDTYRMEGFYHWMRRETGVLMDGDEPAGGEWNYDEENRETPPEDWSPPEPPSFEPDATTREVASWVDAAFETFVDSDQAAPFRWPVTRDQALSALETFVDGRFAEFGPYQDAMVEGEWAMSHSLLSAAINLGLLTPMEVIDRAERAYEAGEVPINSVEGFVRQLLGWREFMRHVYRRSMPEMADANQLDQTAELPPAYWTGETDMACLSEAVGHVREHGYAHHIERLMVLSNFAMVYGADPGKLNEWFHQGFVDAFHWVTTPNVVGMGSFGTDALSSKPYAASGSYINRMSDYCSSCPYAVSRDTGEGACPFNSLYWTFLRENEETLRGTGRMGLMYSHVDDKDAAEWDALEERAATVRTLARQGKL